RRGREQRRARRLGRPAPRSQRRAGDRRLHPRAERAMAQLSHDCFAFGGKLMTTAEARALLDARLTPIAETETAALGDALGRILAADVVAPIAVPPHANSAVDGYAVHFDDLARDAETRLRIAGRAAAG